MQDKPAAPRFGKTWARIVLWHSVLSGLCPLLPIPYVDDAVLLRVRRSMVGDLLGLRGIHVSRSDLGILVDRPAKGCFAGCLHAAIVYPVKKIFRKIFILLTIKECVDEASATFHLGYLLHRAIEEGHIDAPPAEAMGKRLSTVRHAVDRTCAQVDTRPITKIMSRVFSGSRAVMRTAARGLHRIFRRALDGAPGEDEVKAGTILETLQREIWLEQGYLDMLDRTFDENVTDVPRGPVTDGRSR